MPSSSIRSFSDPEAYAAAIRSAKVEITVARRGGFTANFTRIDLHRLWMRRFTESGPRLFHISNVPGRAIVSFLTAPGPEVVMRGIPMPLDGIARNGIADDYIHRTSGPISWGSMSLPAAEMAAAGTAMAGADLAPRRDASLVTPPPAALAKLRRLHAAAGRLAAEAPEIIEHPEVARGMEQALVAGLVGCLVRGTEQAALPARRRHVAIMRRFHRVLADDSGRALYLPELCAAIGVPERTLRACCQEQLGMGPKQYLLLRRLHLAHQALRDTEPGAVTVTEIATRFGFWQFGRFAGSYRALFRETPSATLRRPPR